MTKKHKKYLDEFVRLGNYEIHINGDVYNWKTGKKLKPDDHRGYDWYTLWLDNGKVLRESKHRLVGKLFIPNPENYPIINHIDGNKKNCLPYNLEWCTPYHNNKHARDIGLNNVSKSNSDRWKDPAFRKKTSYNISKGLKNNKTAVGEKNPRFRYRITIDGRPTDRVELTKILNMCQSAVDANIRKAANGKNIKIFDKHGIKVIDIKKHES